MGDVPVRVRPATPQDPASPLIYASAAAYYDRFAGSPADAQRVLAALYPRTGHTGSWELCLVAEEDEPEPRDGDGDGAAPAILGVLAGFPVREAEPLVRAFVARAVPRVRPWHLPQTFAHLRAAARVSPTPPFGAWYVDALAVAPDARRRGVARLLLDAAADRARESGAHQLALDTGIENTRAQQLYTASGFDERSRVRAPNARTARALGGEGFVSYIREL
jgi:ribosomal protein S18 acetylase RimI-like enzyme